MAGNSRLVYSTEKGSVCPDCGRPVKKCACKRIKSESQFDVESDGIIRIRREKKGRKGKTVTTISGFQGSVDDIKQIVSDLKNKCGTGGTIKDGIVIIQGDHREAIQAELKKRSFQVKVTGG